MRRSNRWTSTSWRPRPTPCSWRCPTRSPPKSGRRWPLAARACSTSRAPSGCGTPTCSGKWYPHTPAGDSGATYGLTEHYRDELKNATLVACAGCYPTAAILSLQPLVAAGLLEPGVIIDAKSGISGAGKTPTERTHFSECHGSLSAYGVFAHRHAAEIEQEVGMPVTFVPHLVPIDRGILETIYARLRPGVGAEQIEAR